jgi:hypothetical protein
MSTWPPPERIDPPKLATDERGSLEGWLDYHRSTLLQKCAGLTADQLAIRSCPPSIMSLLGLVRHMTDVEAWFHDYDGRPTQPIFNADPDRDGDFEDVDPARAEDDLAAYLASVERSRAAVADKGLEAINPDTEAGEYSLRWIYQHMIEEYARHNGHADLLRERIDGATGV